ncbi:hypothetical protein DFQ26_002916 [Actinomortierella ambigua]|nr:hypothetical protein DFQ26_002916 [Actinomortierella ambigua]
MCIRTRVRQVKHLQNEQQRRLFINNRIWELGDLLPNIPSHARVDKSGNQKPLTKIYILNKVISFVKKAMEYPPIVAHFQEQMQIEDLKELGAESTAGGISSSSNNNNNNSSFRLGHMLSSTAVGPLFSPAGNHPAFSSMQRSASCGANMRVHTGEDEGDGDDDGDGYGDGDGEGDGDDDDLASPTASIPRPYRYGVPASSIVDFGAIPSRSLDGVVLNIHWANPVSTPKSTPTPTARTTPTTSTSPTTPTSSSTTTAAAAAAATWGAT